MRVRTGRFLRGLKQQDETFCFKAGYDNLTANTDFQWSPATSMLRDKRGSSLSKVQAFTPSHYGGRLATTPSADFSQSRPALPQGALPESRQGPVVIPSLSRWSSVRLPWAPRGP
jgi:hypothetical protein